MGKFYIDAGDRARCYQAIDEDEFFRVNQPLLLSIANTRFGRELLNIPHEYPRIILFKKNCVHWYEGDGQFGADFRIGAKWANVIRFRWNQFTSYARYFEFRPYIEHHGYRNISPATRHALSMTAATLTAYPDPNPETTTVDGTTISTGSAAWATFRTRAGTSSTDSTTALRINIEASGAPDEWNREDRIFTLFDTSSLTSGATISAATESLYCTSSNDGLSTAMSMCMVKPVTASNTAIAAGDHVLSGWTLTEQATRIAQSSFTTSAYNVFTLNASGIASINKTGVTKFGFIEHYIVDNTEPTYLVGAQDDLNFSSADTADTTQDPKLIVTYTVSSASSSVSSSPSSSVSPSTSVSSSVSSSPSSSVSPSTSVSSSVSSSPSSSVSPSTSVSSSPSSSVSPSTSVSSSASSSPSVAVGPLVKYWDGATWQEAPLYYWDGNSWTA